MEILKKELSVDSNQADPSGALRSSDLLRIIQDNVISYFESNNSGVNFTAENHLIWIVSLYHIEIEDMPEYGDKIITRSWCSKKRHGFFTLHSEFEMGGKIIIKSVSNWTLLNSSTHTRAPLNLLPEFDYLTTGTEIKSPSVIKCNMSGSSYKFTVTYSMCDMNRHMNNTTYIGACEDALDAKYLRTHKLSKIDILFEREIKLGETINILYGSDGDRFEFTTEGENPRFIINLEFKEGEFKWYKI